MNNRRMYCPRGKVLGGSSSINAMCFTRGTPEDFNRWNVEGWSWNDLLPHYLATEGQLRKNIDAHYHGFKGEQLIADMHHSVDQLSLDFIRAVEEAGVACRNDDFNGATQEGAGVYQTFQDGAGRRFSAAHAFLHPVRDRPNLTIITNALAERVLFEGTQAIGVLCTVRGKRQQIAANKEVILSAGAINSPQLMLLSGVGDSHDLADHGIKPVHHLPGVGNNLHDHLDVIVNKRVKGYRGVGISLPYMLKLPQQLLRYINHRTGHLASNGAEAGGFVKSDPLLDLPDIQLHFAPLLLEKHFLRTVGHGMCLHLCNLQPKSRGSVKLRSSDPQEPPAIRFNYCQHPDDMKKMVEAVKIGRKIMDGESLRQSITREHSPGAHVQTDGQIEAFVREKAETIYHPVGTCKMGQDGEAVVDNKLRVRGLEHIRIVDASVMPQINSGNTHATVLAIANKAATHILAAS